MSRLTKEEEKFLLSVYKPGRLEGYLKSRGVPWDRVEDLAQEIRVDILEALPHYRRERGLLEAFVFGIARISAKRYRRDPGLGRLFLDQSIAERMEARSSDASRCVPVNLGEVLRELWPDLGQDELVANGRAELIGDRTESVVTYLKDFDPSNLGGWLPSLQWERDRAVPWRAALAACPDQGCAILKAVSQHYRAFRGQGQLAPLLHVLFETLPHIDGLRKSVEASLRKANDSGLREYCENSKNYLLKRTWHFGLVSAGGENTQRNEDALIELWESEWKNEDRVNMRWFGHDRDMIRRSLVKKQTTSTHPRDKNTLRLSKVASSKFGLPAVRREGRLLIGSDYRR